MDSWVKGVSDEHFTQSWTFFNSWRKKKKNDEAARSGATVKDAHIVHYKRALQQLTDIRASV